MTQLIVSETTKNILENYKGLNLFKALEPIGWRRFEQNEEIFKLSEMKLELPDIVNNYMAEETTTLFNLTQLRDKLQLCIKNSCSLNNKELLDIVTNYYSNCKGIQLTEIGIEEHIVQIMVVYKTIIYMKYIYITSEGDIRMTVFNGGSLYELGANVK